MQGGRLITSLMAVALLAPSCTPSSRAESDAKKNAVPSQAAGSGAKVGAPGVNGGAVQADTPLPNMGWDELAPLLEGKRTGWECEPVKEPGWEDAVACNRCRWDEWKVANSPKSKPSRGAASTFPLPCLDALFRGTKLHTILVFLADDQDGALTSLNATWGAPTVTTKHAQCWRRRSWSAAYILDATDKEGHASRELRVTPIRKDTTEDECGRLGPATAEHRKCVEATAKDLSMRMPGTHSAQELIDSAEQLCTFNEKAKRQGQRREEEIERLLLEKK